MRDLMIRIGLPSSYLAGRILFMAVPDMPHVFFTPVVPKKYQVHC